jgi:hypothetical protein
MKSFLEIDTKQFIEFGSPSPFALSFGRSLRSSYPSDPEPIDGDDDD